MRHHFSVAWLIRISVAATVMLVVMPQQAFAQKDLLHCSKCGQHICRCTQSDGVHRLPTKCGKCGMLRGGSAKVECSCMMEERSRREADERDRQRKLEEARDNARREAQRKREDAEQQQRDAEHQQRLVNLQRESERKRAEQKIEGQRRQDLSDDVSRKIKTREDQISEMLRNAKSAEHADSIAAKLNADAEALREAARAAKDPHTADELHRAARATESAASDAESKASSLKHEARMAEMDAEYQAARDADRAVGQLRGMNDRINDANDASGKIYGAVRSAAEEAATLGDDYEPIPSRRTPASPRIYTHNDESGLYSPQRRPAPSQPTRWPDSLPPVPRLKSASQIASDIAGHVLPDPSNPAHVFGGIDPIGKALDHMETIYGSGASGVVQKGMLPVFDKINTGIDGYLKQAGTLDMNPAPSAAGTGAPPIPSTSSGSTWSNPGKLDDIFGPATSKPSRTKPSGGPGGLDSVLQDYVLEPGRGWVPRTPQKQTEGKSGSTSQPTTPPKQFRRIDDLLGR